MELKDKLRRGEKAVGSFMGFPSPVVTEMLGLTGYDFAIMDIEHGNYDNRDVEECLRAAQCADIPCIARIPRADPVTIQKMLDLGADGLMVSMVNTAEQAQVVHDFSVYAPDGKRGISSHTRMGRYGHVSRQGLFSAAKNEKLISVQIETREGVANADSILAVEGIDMIFVGAADMAVSYGYESPTAPELMPVFEELGRKITDTGHIAGIFLPDAALCRRFMDMGYRFFATTVIGVMQSAFTNQVKAIKAL